MRMQPMDHMSDSSSQGCPRRTSGPRYCRVFITEEWCSSAYVALPKSMSLILPLDGRMYWPTFEDDPLFLSQSSSLGKFVTYVSGHCSRMFSGFRSVCVIRSRSCRNLRASMLSFAMLWMSCIQNPRNLLPLRKSYSDAPSGSKTRQKNFWSCMKVSYIRHEPEVPFGSALRMWLKIVASILAFSMYRFTSRMILMATGVLSLH
mmetsp:Transcript_62088/g.176389  ORF Transcript_62088/g.176389 Transcript_62088/m.176389 type:complete len:204 (+) Transcript_62088:219-830(+)